MEETNNTKEPKKKRHVYLNLGLTTFFTIAGCILFFFLVYRFDSFASGWGKFLHAGEPIIIGLVLAYLLNPVMRFCERNLLKLLKKRMKSEAKAKKAARVLGVTGAVLFLLTVIGLLIAAIVPALITSISSLMVTLPDQVEEFIKRLQESDFANSPLVEWISSSLTEVTHDIEQWAKDVMFPMAQTYAAQIISGSVSVVKSIFNFIIGIVVAVYVMMIQETLTGQSKKIIYAIFKPEQGNVIIHTLRKSSDIFGGFISGKLLDSAIIGIICYIGCMILRIPDALLVSVIVGATNVIPFFGPFIGAVPCLLLVVIQDPLRALYLLIFIIVLQQVDGNIIGPKILGNSTGLSSFWVMFAILVAGGVWGFAGMLLGVPTFAVIYYIVTKLVKYRLRKRNLPEATEEYVNARGVDIATNTLRYKKEAWETAEKSGEETVKKE